MNIYMLQKTLNDLEKTLFNLIHDLQSTYGIKKASRKLLREITLYKNHSCGIENWHNEKKEINTKKVQIGGGSHILKDFLNIDIIPPADLICDVREGLPLKSGSVEYIFSEHFLEHIDYPISVKFFIKECYRVLKPKGLFVIGVPDSKLIVKHYINRNNRFYKKAIKKWYSNRNCLKHFNTYIDLLNYHFRDQDDDQKYNPHLWAYDKEKIYSLLKKTGFTKIKNWKFNESIANINRKFGSIYIVAEK